MSCECGQQPCICIIPKDTPPNPPWIITYCTTPGCGSRIRYRQDQGLFTTTCKWCQAGKDYYTQDRAAKGS